MRAPKGPQRDVYQLLERRFRAGRSSKGSSSSIFTHLLRFLPFFPVPVLPFVDASLKALIFRILEESRLRFLLLSVSSTARMRLAEVGKERRHDPRSSMDRDNGSGEGEHGEKGKRGGPVLP